MLFLGPRRSQASVFVSKIVILILGPKSLLKLR
jgi:hypothetical protein